jgi:2-polyprenyl-3-methyl-5-hydroxy-6-metoxy-1,4-benzoquinol methylase
MTANGIELVDCQTCQHRQANLTVDNAHVTTTYADDYFTGGGAGYEDYASEGSMLIARGSKYGKILAKHAAPGKVLDIGAAAGFLAEGMSHAGWHAVGVEPNDTMAAAARARKIDVRTGSAESLLPELGADPTQKFDAVSMIQVIAHLGDPLEVIGTCADLLKPGGLLLIETWDRASFSAKVFGQKWHEYSPPSVVHWFTRKELDSVVARKGFTKIDTGRYPKMITAAHGRQLVEHRMGADHLLSKAARLIPSALKVPYPGDDLFWTIYKT